MIISRTPFRISFAGGGTDIKDFYGLETGAVISTTINRYMYIFLNRRFDGGIRACYSEVEEAEKVNQIKHPIIRECLKLINVSGVDIASIADIPQATGLGSSSSFTVGLLNALCALKSKYLSRTELAELACAIEIDILKEHIGKQDQYAAAYGGLNLIEFESNDAVNIKPILCEPEIKDELNQSLMLIYTGISKRKRASDVISTYNFKENYLVLKEMRELAYEMKDCLEEGKELTDFGLLLDEEWKLKKKLSKLITNEDIDTIYETAKMAGALGGKLCGAGGRGFLLLFVEKYNRQKVRESLWPLIEVPFRFDFEGSRIIYVN